MLSARTTRKLAVMAGSAALAGSLVACSTASEDKPEETKSPSVPASSPAQPSPTEKKVGSSGDTSFRPSVTARPAPTALPGNVITGGR